MKHTFAGLLLFAGLAGAQAPWNHNPASPIGPTEWGGVQASYATCGDSNTGEVGLKQTPINIAAASAITAPFLPLHFSHKKTPFVVENNGHVIEVPYEDGSYLAIGLTPTDFYKLVQFHFHAPSEHKINGVSYDAELHLVHRNAIGELAVVGVLLSNSPTGRPIFTDIITNAPLHHGEFEVHGRELNALELLPAGRGFYRYAGSLTTPPCSESVQWFVLKNPVLITPAALTTLHSVISLFPGYAGYANNNRPVVNLNGRAILKSIQ